MQANDALFDLVRNREDMGRISVVMATYNGEKYIQQQLYSILVSLNSDDEVIVSDDGSTDATLDIVKEVAAVDVRVRLIDGPKKGIISNFSNGISASRYEHIYLSDQDDYWLPEKVETIEKEFEKDRRTTLVLHDVAVVDSELNTIAPSFFELRHSRSGLIHNLIKNSYMGSAMAFSRSLITHVLPIPTTIPMHDQWIGLISDLYGHTAICEEVLGLYRRHDNNASTLSHGTVPSMIKNRAILTANLLARLARDGK